MINGVIEIVAAVLFAVVFLSTGMEFVWLWVAGFYLVCGIVNLAAHTLKNRHRLKQAEKTAKKAEQTVKSSAKTMESVQEPEAVSVQEYVL